MSRIARRPVELPKTVQVSQADNIFSVTGPKGELSLVVNSEVQVNVSGEKAEVVPRSGSRFSQAMAGTTRSLISNMVQGVSDGFERRLQLVGVGYRAQAQGKKLNLTLGFSHPVNYEVPEGIAVETPSQTEVVIRGIDKQQVGQVAAEIRRYRPPEPYKGKGVRYSDERIVLKEAKKK
jgi:large subunit ribosomal protein L6